MLSQTSYPARNVVAILRGRDPRLRHQYVSLTAHNDHVGFNHSPVDHDSLRAYDRVIRPAGADSPNRKPSPEEWTRIHGILDSLRALRPAAARLDPERRRRRRQRHRRAARAGPGPVPREGAAPPLDPVRLAHRARSTASSGSRWFTDHPTVPLDSIVGEIDSDMIGRGGATDPARRAGRPTSRSSARGGCRASSATCSTQVNAAQPRPFMFNLTYDAPGHPLQYYCRADHYNYARYGIPSAVALARRAPGLSSGDGRAAVHRLRCPGAGHVARPRHGAPVREPGQPAHAGCPQAGPADAV